MKQITEAIIEILSIMSWLGVILLLLTIVNISCKAYCNITQLGQKFSWKKVFGGIGKMFLFYCGASLTSVAFSLLPIVNEMINKTSEAELITNEALGQLSTLGVLGICINVIITHGKKALEGITALGKMSKEETQRGGIEK